MKTKVLSMIAIAVLALGTVNLAKAETTKKVVSTTIAANLGINKIEVRGNVELYVSSGPNDGIKVYNNYYAENAFVQNQNGVLRISSYQKEKLVIWVTTNDLQAITAYDNAEIKSFGKFSAISLDVTLYNNSSAKLNLDAYTAQINLKDHSKADLSGNVSECDLQHDYATSLNRTNFIADRFTETRNANKTNSNMELAVL